MEKECFCSAVPAGEKCCSSKGSFLYKLPAGSTNSYARVNRPRAKAVVREGIREGKGRARQGKRGNVPAHLSGTY